jgi:hypothetical protein
VLPLLPRGISQPQARLLSYDHTQFSEVRREEEEEEKEVEEEEGGDQQYTG